MIKLRLLKPARMQQEKNNCILLFLWSFAQHLLEIWIFGQMNLCFTHCGYLCLILDFQTSHLDAKNLMKYTAEYTRKQSPADKISEGIPFTQQSLREIVAKQEEKAVFSCILYCKAAVCFLVHIVLIILMNQHKD